MFSVNLGGGIITSAITIIAVDDGESHDISFTRKGKTMELVLDDMYSTRSVAPGSDELMDVSSDDIYLGSDPSLGSGFVGCLSGVRIDNKDLPTSDANDYFIATLSEGGRTQTCNERQTESFFKVFNSLYVLGGVSLGLLVIFAAVYVVVSKSVHYCYAKRRNKLGFHSQRRDPIFSPVNPIAIHRRSLRQTLSRRELSQTFLQQTNSFEHLAVVETGNSRAAGQLRPISNTQVQRSTPSPVKVASPTRPATFQPPQLEVPPTGTSTGSYDKLSSVLPPGVPDKPSSALPPKVPKKQPPPRVPNKPRPVVSRPIAKQNRPPPDKSKPEKTKLSMTLDPMTGMPLSEPDGNGGRDSTGDSISNGDIHSYIMDRVKSVNEQLPAMDCDELQVFCDEGPYQPLGSVGSLYDILNYSDEEEEAVEEEEEEEVRIVKMEVHCNSNRNYDQNTLSPLLSSYSRSPTKTKKYKQHIFSVSPKVSPKILRRAVPSSSRRKRLEEKQLPLPLIVNQLQDTTNSQWLKDNDQQVSLL